MFEYLCVVSCRTPKKKKKDKGRSGSRERESKSQRARDKYEEKLRKKEKEMRKLRHELATEKEKFNQMVGKNQADLQNLQAKLYEESQARLKLSMELDTKESEVETLQQKLVHLNLDTESINSGNPITLNEN